MYVGFMLLSINHAKTVAVIDSITIKKAIGRLPVIAMRL